MPNYKKKSNKKQRGGKIVLPVQYFNPEAQGNYSVQPVARANNLAVSNGVIHNNSAGPDLHSQIGLDQSGGGPMPIEFYGGDSGRYFADGAPELQACDSPYGVVHATSHGVVLDSPGDATLDAQGKWMGPNLSPGPFGLDMTGGRRRKSKRSKSKRSKSKRSKSKRSKSKRSKSRKGNK